jgi:hypothetical protein
MQINQQFDAQFQKHFVGYLLRDTQMLVMMREHIQPELFSNEILSSVVRALLDFYDRYHTAPDELILRHVADMAEKRLLPEKLAGIIIDLCRELLTEKLQNRDYLIDKYDVILKHIAFGPALQDAAELAKKGEFDLAQERIRKAMQGTPRGKMNLGSEFTLDPTARILRRRTQEQQVFYTLIPAFDTRRIYIKRGELGVIQGQKSNIGKSAALAFLGRNLVFQGWRVMIYTLEMSEGDYEDRLDMCCSGLPFWELESGDLLRARVQRMIKRNNMLRIKQFPSYSTSVDKLREHTKMLWDIAGFRPDVVLCDYADLLDPGMPGLRSDIHAKGDALYSQLRGWAVEEQIGMWTVSQSGRSAESELAAEQRHIAGSINKIHIADVVVSINRSPEDEVNGMTRIKPTKLRNAAKTEEFSIPTDLDRMQWWSSAREYSVNMGDEIHGGIDNGIKFIPTTPPPPSAPAPVPEPVAA